MPFLIADDLDAREKRIMGFLEEREPVIAILLAAADFERTVRRAILGLSTEPTKKIRKKLATEYGAINKYPCAWQRFVTPRLKRVLALTSASGDEPTKLHEPVLTDFASIRKAFKLRNELIHGDHGTVGVEYASERVKTLLDATRAVTEYAQANDVDLIKRLKPRPRPRPRKQS